jgi:GNAT superfamily N-acetyltransferase
MNLPKLLPDLPPDLSFPSLGACPGDLDFAFESKRQALGPHVAARWGWDDAFQREVHIQRFSAKPLFAIQRAEERLGTISVEVQGTSMRLGEFYLFPGHQGQGIGTRVLQHCLELADHLQLPVRLEYLIWNPVGALYRRCGFVEHARSDIHVFLERPPTSL